MPLVVVGVVILLIGSWLTGVSLFDAVGGDAADAAAEHPVSSSPKEERLVDAVLGDAQIREVRWRADQGNAEAQFQLGDAYAHGKGVVRDDAEAVRWYRRAADQGHAGGQFNHGDMYA
jgi:hypothetical protein